MSNPSTLKPFKKGKDERRNMEGRPVGAFSLTTAVKEFLKERYKDGKTYGEKLKEAAVVRAITKSDVLMKEIWDRVDGKIPQGVEMSGKDGEPIQVEEKISGDAVKQLSKKYEEELRKVVSKKKDD